MPAALQKAKKKLFLEKPLNYKRALWLNHEAVTEGRENKAETGLRVATEEKRLLKGRLQSISRISWMRRRRKPIVWLPSRSERQRSRRLSASEKRKIKTPQHLRA